MAALDADALFAAVETHAMASGFFEAVNGHESTSPPGHGLTADVWVQIIEPVPGRSGLASTSARVELSVRIYRGMADEPQAFIDPSIIAATNTLMLSYSGAFQLGLGEDHHLDLLGTYGEPLRGRAGYLTIGSRLYRVMVVTIPIIINDAWPQDLT